MSTSYESYINNIKTIGSDLEILKPYQESALKTFNTNGFPDPKEEDYKNINLSSLITEKRLPATPKEQVTLQTNQNTSLKKLSEYPVQIQEKWIQKLSKPSAIQNPFKLINIASINDIYILDLQTSEDIHINCPLSESSPYNHFYLFINAASHTSSTVTLKTHCKKEDKIIINHCIEGTVQDNANLTLLTQYNTGTESIILSDQLFDLNTESKFSTYQYNKNTKISRHHTQIDFKGENAEGLINGLNLLEGTAEVHNHTKVIHHEESCFCHQLFKNILTEKANAEFNGLVYVHKDAQETDSNQANHNLILSDQARALSRPQLEIFADNVKCSHGATTGQIDPEKIHYLVSRGIPKPEARTILTEGFAWEVFEDFPDQKTQKTLKTNLLKDLETIL